MRRTALWTGAAVVLAVAIAGALLVGPLTRAEPRLAASNLIRASFPIAELEPDAGYCQDGEAVPQHASRISLFMEAVEPAGPVEVTVRRAPQEPPVARTTIAEVSVPGAYTTALPPRDRGLLDATVCLRNRGLVAVKIIGEGAGAKADPSGGAPPPTAQGGRERAAGSEFAVDGRIRLEYPRVDGARTPLAMAGEVARRNGLWRGQLEGPWLMWVALGLTLAAGATGVVLVLRRPARIIVVCAAVATISALAWAVVTPVFQVPDETVHVGYTQYLAETGELPVPQPGANPPEDLSIGIGSIPFTTTGKTDWRAESEDAVDRHLERDLGRVSSGGGGYVANNPPLYYGIQALPYHAAYGATIYDRVVLMRLVNTLLAGLLAAVVCLFLRELFPRRPLLHATGALAVALHPVVGFLGGGVNPDSLMAVLGATLLWLAARAFRRGIDPRIAVAFGAVLGAALLTKPAALGLVPGAVLLLTALVLCAPVQSRRRAAVTALGCLAVAAAVFVAWEFAEESLWARPTSATAGFGSANTRGGTLTLREGLSYLWQFYLPPLPSMQDQQPVNLPIWNTYFQGFVGRFGWHQFAFGTRVSVVALMLVAALTVLAASALWRGRVAGRARAVEGGTYLLAFGTFAVVVHVAGYRYLTDVDLPFEQVRYLFPYLLPLYGAFVALAVAGARSWRAPLAAFLVTLFALHNLAAQLLSLERYYL